MNPIKRTPIMTPWLPFKISPVFLLLALSAGAAQPPDTLEVTFRTQVTPVVEGTSSFAVVVVTCRIVESVWATSPGDPQRGRGHIAEGTGFAVYQVGYPILADACRDAREEAKKEAERILQRMHLRWRLDSDDPRYGADRSTGG